MQSLPLGPTALIASLMSLHLLRDTLSLIPFPSHSGIFLFLLVVFLLMHLYCDMVFSINYYHYLKLILYFFRLLLETKYRRLPVVDGDGKLVSLCQWILI